MVAAKVATIGAQHPAERMFQEVADADASEIDRLAVRTLFGEEAEDCVGHRISPHPLFCLPRRGLRLLSWTEVSSADSVLGANRRRGGPPRWRPSARLGFSGPDSKASRVPSRGPLGVCAVWQFCLSLCPQI